MKQTNLIFIEHKKNKLEIEEYKNIINVYDSTTTINNKIIETFEEEVSILKNDITLCEELIFNQENELKKQQRKLKILKGVSIGGVTVSGALLLILLIK